MVKDKITGVWQHGRRNDADDGTAEDVKGDDIARAIPSKSAVSMIGAGPPANTEASWNPIGAPL